MNLLPKKILGEIFAWSGGAQHPRASARHAAYDREPGFWPAFAAAAVVLLILAAGVALIVAGLL